MRAFFLVCVMALALPATALAQGKARDKGRPSHPSAPAATPPTPTPSAATPGPNDRVVFKKRTVIDFTGALIEGDLIKPEGSYVVSRKASRFSSLIRVRENYLPELIASPNDL